MLQLQGDDRESVLAIGQRIDSEDLTEKGVETDPHVTLCYGLTNPDPQAASQAIVGQSPFPFRLAGDLDAFLDADTGDGYDVLFVPIENAERLREMNQRLRRIGCESTHGFHPHATVAYVKPGMAAKYVDAVAGPGRQIGKGELVFSDPDKNRTLIDTQVFADPHRDTALPGPDGKRLAELIRDAQHRGTEALAELTRDATRRAVRAGGVQGSLLNDQEQQQLAHVVAGINSIADLLGRARVRELAERASGKRQFSDTDAFVAFAEPLPDVAIAAPESAIEYFRRLIPSLGIDPERWAGDQRRKAFTVAESTNDVLTRRIQDAIKDAVSESRDGTPDIDDLLDAAGVHPSNPQYSEMVWRTNAQDAYQTAAWEEARSPEMRDEFPAWRYLGVDDSRAGEDHRPKFNKVYPADATFSDVRGDRPYNCRCGLAWLTTDELHEHISRGGKVESAW